MSEMDEMSKWGEEWKDILEGKYPWNYKDFMSVANWMHELKQKPLDDWDLKERGLLLEDEQGCRKITINNFLPENQLGIFMMKNFGVDVFRRQFYRFMEIMQFVRKNRDRLEKDKMLIKGKSFDATQDELIEVLCILPFSKKTGKGKKIRHTFNYKEVIEKANELLAKLE